MTVVPSTDSTTSKGQDEGGSRTGTKPGRLRRVATVVSLLLMLATGSVATAGVASADAGATATVCFRHPNGSPYTYDVYAQKYSNGQWVNVTSTRAVNGCSNWTLAAGQYIKFQAFYRVGSTFFIGNSEWKFIYSGWNYNYGTNLVTMAWY